MELALEAESPAERTPPLDTAQLRARLIERLGGTRPDTALAEWRVAGLPAAQGRRFRDQFPADPIPAAVLVPIVDHGTQLNVLLTLRAAHLRQHAGQVSFPGGRIEATDAGALGAALREAEEEIGLPPGRVAVFGYLPDHLIISGYRVTPVVGWVEPGYTLNLDPSEVHDAFEVPLLHVLDAANHRLRTRQFGTEHVSLYDIPFGERNIWGATAGMLMTLRRLLTEELP